jgi:hypothetical protein
MSLGMWVVVEFGVFVALSLVLVRLINRYTLTRKKRVLEGKKSNRQV